MAEPRYGGPSVAEAKARHEEYQRNRPKYPSENDPWLPMPDQKDALAKQHPLDLMDYGEGTDVDTERGFLEGMLRQMFASTISGHLWPNGDPGGDPEQEASPFDKRSYKHLPYEE